MNQASHLENRLIELEMKSSFHEDLIDKLDQVVIRQQSQIDALVREVILLRQHSTSAAAGELRTTNPQDDLPPHY